MTGKLLGYLAKLTAGVPNEGAFSTGIANLEPCRLRGHPADHLTVEFGGENQVLYRLKKFLFRLGLRIWSGPWYPNIYVMIHSVHLPRAVYVAAELGIADLLKERAYSIGELAQVTQTDERSLYRIMRLLAAYDVFAEDRGRVFGLAKHGKTLLSDDPESSRWWVLSLGDELWKSNSEILESVRTGKTGFEIAHGERVWSWYPKHPREHDIFIKGMNGFTRMHCQELVRAFDFSRFNEVVDVGGGGGGLICEILKANPGLNGVLFDQPRTIDEEGRGRIESMGLSHRCEAVGGNFLEALPEGADAYLFKHVLRDWDDQGVRTMLGNCRKAMPENGTLLIVDAVVNPANGTDRLVKLIDVQMMVDAGGGLRTLSEFEQIFADTGFEIVKIHKTMSLDADIIEAKPIRRPVDESAAAQNKRPEAKRPESEREVVQGAAGRI